MPSRQVLRRRSRRRLLQRSWMPLLALLLAALALRIGLDLRPVAMLVLWLACITPSLVRIDVVQRRLPNRIVLPALLVGLPLVVLDAAVDGRPVWEPLGAGLLVGGFLYLCAMFGGLGMGDVKLGALLGLTVGCFGIEAVLLFSVVAVSTAGVVGGVIVIAGRLRGGTADWRTRIPFGPFLLLGAWTSIALSS
ncbi:A24 family peptidase [Plantibacter flavus]|uniref:prepilin peptidase n=1 Tax=Plantibacter flavus TaxID=150123 RepID=UPI003F13782C